MPAATCQRRLPTSPRLVSILKTCASPPRVFSALSNTVQSAEYLRQAKQVKSGIIQICSMVNFTLRGQTGRKCFHLLGMGIAL